MMNKKVTFTKRSLAALALSVAGLMSVSAEELVPTKQGGTVGILSNSAINNLNPALQSGTATAIPGSQIFSSLLIADDKWDFHPYIAKEWKQSEDGLSFTFILNDQARFHDGKPVTAKDVAFSILLVRDNHPFGKSIYANLDSVETPDDHTVVVKLNKPNPAMLLAVSTPALLPILPEHIYGENAGPIRTNPFNNKPIGSGPFKFEKYEPGQHLTLQRFDEFVLGKPKLDKITLAIINDRNAAGLALQRGDLHYAPYPPLRFADVARLGSGPTLSITNKGYEGVGALTWIEFNFKKDGPLKNKLVRQALAYAIDRNFITEKLHLGQTKPAYGAIHPSSPFFNPNQNKYEFDLEKANQLLDEAGYPKNAEGVRFELTMDYFPGGVDQTKNVAEYLRSHFAPIGVRLQMRPSPDMPTWMQRISNYDYDMNIDIVYNWGDPIIGVSRTYMSTNIRPGVPWANMSAYENPRVDELLTAAAVENDVEKRKELYNEFQAIVNDELPVTWLNLYPGNTIFNKKLVNLPLGIWGPFTPMHEMGWEK